MNYHYSRIQLVLWRIGDLLARLLLGLVLLGIVEAGQQCGPEQVPALERAGTIVRHEGNRIDIEGAPVWGCAVRTHEG